MPERELLSSASWSTTVILFWVSVPVLSEQMIWAQPRVSTAVRLADDGVALGHVGHADGEHDGDHGGQTLGNGRHGQGDGDHEGVEKVTSGGQIARADRSPRQR